ncbi:MAG: ABC transporter permease subunit [Acidimicrobiia bacterium]|nr:ABC transporter permease subunit [Acidimicrobiia bacterium]
MNFLTGLLAQTDSGKSIWDNLVLDEYEIPFGEWADQSVDWIDNNLGWLLDAINWPFDTLIGFLVNDFLAQISWVWVVLGMGLIAALVRNVKVGAFVALALAACGILGNAYWIETARTIGFIGVAVILCVIVGIPIGIAAGRVDAIWQVTRPILDAMQVVHSFVYMLPFIFFWGIGEVSATMVTMVFALPPLIRLTNLGIRQVPADVVEAARSFGAPERRVLFDVQLPLARPAIMTGINQTLLLAISMLGIAAIMGAGGLGRLLFRALSNQDVALAASGGLAFFLVAVVLDRMSQREDTDTGNLWQRIREAWAHRRDPEGLLPDEDEGDAVATFKPEETYAPISPKERLPLFLTLGGGAVAAIAAFLPWTSGAGKISAWGRRADEELVDQTFSGLHASGGSWFGIVVLGLGLFAVAAAVSVYLRPGRGARWLTTDGAALAMFGVFGTALMHVLANKPPLAADPGTGIGVILALVGGLVGTVGGIMWLRVAPHTPFHPLKATVAKGRLIGVAISVVFLLVGALSAWSFDARQDVIISPEIEAQIEELQQRAQENPADAAVIANDIANLLASAQAEDAIILDGITSEGTQLGLWTLLTGILALGTTVPAIGLIRGVNDRRNWVWSAITAGLGAIVALTAFGWIATHVRSADPNFFSGVGSFLTLAGGFFIVASTMSVLKEFRRSQVYEPLPQLAEAEASEDAEAMAGAEA